MVLSGAIFRPFVMALYLFLRFVPGSIINSQKTPSPMASEKNNRSTFLEIGRLFFVNYQVFPVEERKTISV